MVLLVGPEHPQPRVVGWVQDAQQPLGSLGVVNRSGGHQDGQQQTQGINEQMALTAGDLLAAIVATLPADLCPLDCLAVQVGNAGAGWPTFGETKLAAQRALNRRPGAVITP